MAHDVIIFTGQFVLSLLNNCYIFRSVLFAKCGLIRKASSCFFLKRGFEILLRHVGSYEAFCNSLIKLVGLLSVNCNDSRLRKCNVSCFLCSSLSMCCLTQKLTLFALSNPTTQIVIITSSC